MTSRLGALVGKLEALSRIGRKRHFVWIERGDKDAALDKYGRERVKPNEEVVFVGWND
jgi:hypothetical protein